MATLADVARHAGVAASTVSYVLSGKRTVSASTRRRVERSIELLNYHPHAGAQALASSRSNIVALVVPLRSDLYLPVMMEIAIAVTTTARRFGHDVLLLTNDEGAEGIRRVAVSARADAMILMDVSMEDERIPMLIDVGIPAVMIGIPPTPGGLPASTWTSPRPGNCVSSISPASATASWPSSARPRPSTSGTAASPKGHCGESRTARHGGASGWCTVRARAVTRRRPAR